MAKWITSPTVPKKRRGAVVGDHVGLEALYLVENLFTPEMLTIYMPKKMMNHQIWSIRPQFFGTS